MRTNSSRRRNRKRIRALILGIVLLAAFGCIAFMVKGWVETHASKETQFPPFGAIHTTDESDPSDSVDADHYTDIRIAAAGDIMFHSTQLESAYDAAAGTYDFKSMFEDVKPIISSADLALANFETTTAGDARPYTGYPAFNSPDEVVDAIQYAGFDALTTANNHSLDTGSEGLKRTVETLQRKGMATFGTYNRTPDSRVLMKEVKGIRIALLAYTESTNGLGSKYSDDELNAMINLMDTDRIVQDIREAKELGAELIIAFMHWGVEYEEQPNAGQAALAKRMAEEGVDIILGSHPHVIQKSEQIEVQGKKAFVIYSMGNFISNQRKETLDSRNELTEDGIIINFDIRKDNLTNEIMIQNVEYVPTWVYRNKEAGQAKYTYRILPVESFLGGSEIAEEFQKRMKRSLDATVSKLDQTPFVKQ